MLTVVAVHPANEGNNALTFAESASRAKMLVLVRKQLYIPSVTTQEGRTPDHDFRPATHAMVSRLRKA